MKSALGDIFTLLIVLAIAGLALFLYFKFFKLHKIKNICFIDGSLGTGKSFYSVALAVRFYKRALRLYKLKRILLCIGHKLRLYKGDLEALEEPVLYSNIALRNIKFTRLTKDLLFRKTRFAYKSVLLIDEFSLLADQYCYKDREMSERLSLFFKLFRHECHGGYVIINSQSTSDLHYSLKYVLSDYLYIHHRTKFPFVTLLSVQEMAYCADKDGNQVVNAHHEDVESTLRPILCLNRYYKYYDTYCYSIFTDNCPVYRNDTFNAKRAYIKDTNLVSFKEFKYLYENLREEKEHEQA